MLPVWRAKNPCLHRCWALGWAEGALSVPLGSGSFQSSPVLSQKSSTELPVRGCIIQSSTSAHLPTDNWTVTRHTRAADQLALRNWFLALHLLLLQPSLLQSPWCWADAVTRGSSDRPSRMEPYFVIILNRKFNFKSFCFKHLLLIFAGKSLHACRDTTFLVYVHLKSNHKGVSRCCWRSLSADQQEELLSALLSLISEYPRLPVTLEQV